MEAAPLVGAYKRYKAGTKKLIQWLFDSATARDGVDPSHSPKTKKKKSIPHVTRKIRVDELIPLAQKIVAAKDPAVDIPLSILDCAKDTITGRQQSALWYANKGDVQSNFTHRYFLTTLEEIFNLLRSETKSRRPKRKKKIELATDSNDLGNVFLHLELEDPSIGEDENEPLTKATPPPKDQQPVELEMSKDDIENDQRFAIWCLMDDLHKIRVHVREVWQQYKRGELSLQATCEITERAIRIMDLLRSEFLSDHPTLITWKNILECIGLERYVRNARGVEPWVCSSQDHEHEGPSTTCHSDRLCMPAWCALQDYTTLAMWVRDVKPTSDAGDVPYCTFPGHPFARALLNITADLVELASADCAGQFDIYTWFLLTMAGDGRETFGPHILVATQIQMEIWDILDGQTERGMLEASATIEQLTETLNRFDQFAKDYDSRDPGKRLAMDVTGGPGARPCLNCKVNQTQGERKGWVYAKLKPIFLPSNVLATLPILCGVAAFHQQVDFTTHGSILCTANMFTLAAAHLYKAARVQGSLDVKWDDMDFLIARQNTQGPFVRDVEGSDSVELVAKQYCLALGMPLTQVAGKHHPALPPANFCASKANKVHDASVWLGANRSQCESTATPFQFFYECARSYMATHKTAENRLTTQWEQTKRLTPCQLLFIVQEVLREDEPHINFDLYRFSRRAIELTMGCCEMFLRDSRNASKIGKRQLMPYVVVGEVLWAAASMANRGNDRSTTVLHVAAQKMRDIINMHGREALDQAMPLSSGHIPDAEKPVVRYSQTPNCPKTSTYYPGLLNVEYEPMFPSAYVADSTEAEILENVVAPWRMYLDEEPFPVAEVPAAIDVCTHFANHFLAEAGIDRFAHVTLEENLTLSIRTITPAQHDCYHGDLSLRHLQKGIYVFNGGFPTPSTGAEPNPVRKNAKF